MMKLSLLSVYISAALALVALTSASAADAPFAQLKWREIGPALSGGRVAAVAGTGQDDMLYYIGAAGGGVWKSQNAGATWSPVFDGQSVAAIGAIAIDPTNKNVVWVGTGETNPRNDVSYGDGLYKSTNGGKSWRRVGLENTRYISRIRIDPRNPNHVVVGACGDFFAATPNGGVYLTNDGGRTWTKTLYVGEQTGASDVAMDPSNPNVVFAGMWQFHRVPWTFTSGGPDDGLYKSMDGGRHWTRLTGHGLPAGITGRIGLAIAPSAPKRVYALIEAKGGILWRSDDDGVSWKLMTGDTLVDQRPFYFTHIEVDPRNANHVYGVSEALSESKNGGLKFEEIAKSVHVDYHAIWIAPNDPGRIIVGEDGGYAITLDSGKNWEFSRNLPIGQIYHLGLSNENPYWICGGWQDNNAYCGPSNSLDADGIKDRAWMNVVGGDGMWAIPDPIDPNLIWTDLQDGRVSIFNRKVQTSRFIVPYQTFNRDQFDLRGAQYRFNWDSPIAFAPWDGHTAWYGGNVVFQSLDHGEHWSPISPDLTLNVKEHQKPAGGPLALDVSGAEYSDTILYIEGSRLNRGEIWVGTDDGLVQLTRDGGRSWQNVTPPGVAPFGRIEAVSPSPLVAGTAYVNVDRHRSGDYRPYVFVTHDYGTTWTSIANGLPQNQYVRTVRPDDRNANLIYAGTENGLFITNDGGRSWQSFRLNLPQVSVRDIRIQPEFNDIAIATHGRAFWVLDDATSLQQLAQAQRAGVMLFKARTAYEYHYHANDEGAYTRYTGQNPPGGAILDFYQAKAQKSAPVVYVYGASGALVREIKGTHKVRGKDVPYITNKPGINRVIWDFHENGPTRWMGAAREEYRGPLTGSLVVPGTYTARMTLDGQTLTQSFDVKPDPRDAWTQSDYQAAHDFAERYSIAFGKIDETLNNLDTIKKSLDAARKSAGGNSAMSAKIDDARKARDAVFSAFTADYHNDEDSIQRPGALREDVPRVGFGSQQPPTAETLRYAAQFDGAYQAALAKYDDFVDSLGVLSGQLKAAGIKPVDGAHRVSP